MEIQLVSYNIHKGFTLGNTRYVLPEIKRQLRLTRSDIVFLQEAKGNHPKHSQRFNQANQYEYLADQSWMHYAYGQNVKRKGGHGNAILSRFPILSSDNIDLSFRKLERRGLLHCRLDCDLPEPLNVFCTHLNLRESDRSKQIDMIIDYINNTISPSAPIILGGDFNDWRGVICAPLLHQCGLENVHAKFGTLAKTFPSHRPVLALDRIYARGLNIKNNPSIQSENWAKLSDHAPIAATLKLNQTSQFPNAA